MTVRGARSTIRHGRYVCRVMGKPVSLYWYWEKPPAGKKTARVVLSSERRDGFFGQHWRRLVSIQMEFG